MTAASPGDRVADQLGRLLLRGTRQYLYQRLVDGVDGLDVATYPVLSGLGRLGPTTATHLASVIGVDRSATTRYATKLEAGGLVHRTVDPDDARATRLALTPAGTTALAATRRALSSAMDDVLSQWPPAEAAAFAASLERFTDGLQDMAGTADR
ncbi:MarR family transcriptional regulator [Mycolicibacterium sp. P1-18]|uniref:MarR family winged helix-turn-helix transcriptional regulator n=1 Tax=Mycolicibacterium sp. P1-18 TaxID=2024615 RepID=UPI0011F233DD|nr:MarR family transcriptional regulator [Mycolicibacterium sp. P1-18]KAA0099513.1 MarR family transcriptional regulator [Mycolicibacterium sp. P1-18]